MIVYAKLAGLYDRDETLLRKTTLEEVPKLLQMATMTAFVAWLCSGIIFNGTVDRAEDVLFWATFALVLALARAASRALSLRLAPTERCIFIGDPMSAEAIKTKLEGHCGTRAEVVAEIDLAHLGAWSMDTFSPARVEEVLELACDLDVHRAIIAPRTVDAGEMLNLVRTLKAVGVRVSVLPRPAGGRRVIGGVRRPARSDRDGCAPL